MKKSTEKWYNLKSAKERIEVGDTHRGNLAFASAKNGKPLAPIMTLLVIPISVKTQTLGELELEKQSENRPIVTIEKWLTEGWKVYKRAPFTFSFATMLGVLILPIAVIVIFRLMGGPLDWAPAVGTLISIPLFSLLFIPPLYTGLYYMALKSMRGNKPRIRDIFRGFKRYWGGLALWVISIVGTILLCLIPVGQLCIPLLWAITMLAFPLLIDQKMTIGAAFSTACKTVLTWQNFWRFWLQALFFVFISFFGFIGFGISCLFITMPSIANAQVIISFVGLIGFGVCIFITVPFIACAQVVGYRDIFKPEEVLESEPGRFWQEYPFKLKAEYLGLISRIRDLRGQIFDQIERSSERIKPMFEPSIEHIEGVFSKAIALIRRLQEIETYLQTTDVEVLHGERSEIHVKITTSNSAQVASQYEEALKAVEERLANHEQLETLAAQIHAQLATIQASLDSTLAKIVRIRTSELSNERFESDNVSGELQSLRIEMDALLESLDEMARTT